MSSLSAKPRLERILVAVLVAAVLVTFGPVLGNGFIGTDDPGYITENVQVRAGLTLDGVRWAFTTFHMGHWHPLTWLSHMLDWELWGPRAPGHHLTSLVLHALTAGLLFFLLARWTGAPWRSFFAAALFSLHPLRVETVAWAADRKDSLSLFLAVLTLWLYGRHVQAPGRSRYGAALLAFALGLLAKATLVTLPVLLLLMDVWPLRRLRAQGTPGAMPWRRLLVEKVPFLALSLASALVAVVAPLLTSAMVSLEASPLHVRLRHALLGYVGYLSKTLWPAGLSVFYPLPAEPLPWGAALGVGLALLAMTALLVRRWRTHPALLVGWCWFLVAILPVSGLMQAGMQAMADRYTGLATLGFALALAGSLPAGGPRARRYVLGGVGVGLAGVLAALSMAQVRRWEDSETLYTHVREVSPGNFYAEGALSVVREKQGRLEEAEAHAREALRLAPWSTVSHGNLGRILLAQGRVQEALPLLETAYRQQPGTPLMRDTLAQALVAAGRAEEGLRVLRAALERGPDDVAARMELGLALARLGRAEQALEQFLEASRRGGGVPRAHLNAGVALARLGRFQEALAQLDEALRLAPGLEEARVMRGRVLEDLARR